MRIIGYETKEVRKDSFTCDRCGVEIVEKDLGQTIDDCFECEISATFGHVQDWESPNVEKYRVDLCEDCASWMFNELLPNNGVKVNND